MDGTKPYIQPANAKKEQPAVALEHGSEIYHTGLTRGSVRIGLVDDGVIYSALNGEACSDLAYLLQRPELRISLSAAYGFFGESVVSIKAPDGTVTPLDVMIKSQAARQTLTAPKADGSEGPSVTG